ncbi:MAG TPA: methyltransferase domain-containing protein [Solirubrobacterales bacterium]|jgi:SAM-dependent methyltransferase|nr:methyltransferase domain-containing protein [Solirubrobacterales bacterium]
MAERPDLEQATAAQQAMWAKGDFAEVAPLVVPVSEKLADSLQLLPDERVLDVACGSGNAALAAARRTWGNVTGADFVPALLERGRERAAAERLRVEFVEADAQNLPFGDGEFDVTMSVFGVMFAPDHQRAADELLRVTKSGGRIGVASWCPDGGLQDLFAAIVKHTGGPPPGTPPVLWGAEDHVRELFGDSVSDLRAERLKSRQAFRSPEHYIDFFRDYFGPIQAAFETVGAEGEQALRSDLEAVLENLSVGDQDALVVEPEYLQVLATRA